MTKLDEAADDLDATIKFWSYTLLGLDAATVQSRPAADRWSISEAIEHLRRCVSDLLLNVPLLQIVC